MAEDKQEGIEKKLDSEHYEDGVSELEIGKMEEFKLNDSFKTNNLLQLEDENVSKLFTEGDNILHDLLKSTQIKNIESVVDKMSDIGEIEALKGFNKLYKNIPSSNDNIAKVDEQSEFIDELESIDEDQIDNEVNESTDIKEQSIFSDKDIIDNKPKGKNTFEILRNIGFDDEDIEMGNKKDGEDYSFINESNKDTPILDKYKLDHHINLKEDKELEDINESQIKKESKDNIAVDKNSNLDDDEEKESLKEEIKTRYSEIKSLASHNFDSLGNNILDNFPPIDLDMLEDFEKKHQELIDNRQIISNDLGVLNLSQKKAQPTTKNNIFVQFKIFVCIEFVRQTIDLPLAR